MSTAGHEEERKETREEGKREQEASQASVEGRSQPLNLFKAVGVKNPAYWQCIFYIAPNNEQKKWKPSDAVGTYCKECKIIIPYDGKKNPRAVSRHMDRFHKDLLESFERNDNKKRKLNGKIEAFFPKEVKRVKVATKADQDHFTKLIARWTACCLRPFAISEDVELQDVINFATQVNGTLALPSRNTNKSRIDDLAKEICTKVMKVIAQKCDFFSSTSDMWSSRSMKAFLAFTVHFLCNDFHRFNYTLAVKPTKGKHTGGMIRQYMQDILNEWCLPEHRLTMMLRDSGSNMVKACQDWGVPHFPCIGHSLHLVVGPFLLQKKEKSTTNATEEAYGVEMPDLTGCDNDGNNDDATEDDGEVNDPYSDEFTDSYNNENALKAVRKIVSKVRKITNFIKNSTKCREILEKLQVAEGCQQLLQVSLDVCTRWNSTLKMVIRTLELKETINKFLKFYKSPLGKQEFKGAKTKLDAIEEKEWAILHGICYLLGSFDSSTKYLSGETYASFVTAFPVLRFIKQKIGSELMFQFQSSDLERSKFKRNFYGQYGNDPFFEEVVRDLNSCRVLLLNEFNVRFQSMNANIMWTTLLDPRFNLKSNHWKDEDEKSNAKKLLMNSVEEVVCRIANVATQNISMPSYSSSSDKSDDENAIDLFSSCRNDGSSAVDLSLSAITAIRSLIVFDCY